MNRYEIQTKVEGKWTLHGTVDADDEGAKQAWRYWSGTLAAPARLITHDYKGRIVIVAKQAARTGYRVVYGETAPVWSRIFPTKDQADKFAAKHRSFGDVIFSVEAVNI